MTNENQGGDQWPKVADVLYRYFCDVAGYHDDEAGESTGDLMERLAPILSALSPSEQPEPVAWHERAIAEQMDEGAGFWKACSGCQEGVDGYVSTKDYPYSKVFRCQPGGGCSECGGLGVLWDDIDYDDMARSILAADAQPSEQTGGGGVEEVAEALWEARCDRAWPGETEDLDPESDDGTLLSIVRDDAKIAVRILAALKPEPQP